MPISRPLLIVFVTAIVALFGFYATQSMRNSTEASAPVVPTAPTEPPATKAPAKSDAKAVKTDKPAAKPDRVAATPGVPPAVERALDARKQVVLFLYKPGSSDDRATARAVGALRGTRGVAVFTDPIGRLGKYRGLVRELAIAQAPAVVIVGKDRSARVVEGYIDPATLAQDVADAR